MSFTTQYHELYKQISEIFIRKQMSGALENYATPLISKLQPDENLCHLIMKTSVSTLARFATQKV